MPIETCTKIDGSKGYRVVGENGCPYDSVKDAEEAARKMDNAKRTPLRLYTTINEGHMHVYKIGSTSTESEMGHKHLVVDGVIQDAQVPILEPADTPEARQVQIENAIHSHDWVASKFFG